MKICHSTLITTRALPPNTMARVSDLSQRIHDLAYDPDVRKQIQSRNFAIQTITWEDCARSKNSCWGPNITDQTLDVEGVSMPVIREPNFSDKTCDIPIDRFSLRTGNESGSAELKSVSLKDYLISKDWYCAEKDQNIMVSTQTCLLPLEDGHCKFGVKLYNYQTSLGHSTLAVIVSSAQGTSTAPIHDDNQVLYFNSNGTARPFEARRLEEDRKERGVSNLPKLKLTDAEMDRNVLLVFHVPLEPDPARVSMLYVDCEAEEEEECEEEEEDSMESAPRGFDAAVLRVSAEDKGPFPTFDPSKKYKRDPRYPIRLVLQNYAGTDTAELSEETLDYVVSRLQNPYKESVAQGSHVTGSGDANRTTVPDTSQL